MDGAPEFTGGLGDDTFTGLVEIGWMVFVVFIGWHLDRKIENKIETKLSI